MDQTQSNGADKSRLKKIDILKKSEKRLYDRLTTKQDTLLSVIGLVYFGILIPFVITIGEVTAKNYKNIDIVIAIGVLIFLVVYFGGTLLYARRIYNSFMKFKVSTY